MTSTLPGLLDGLHQTLEHKLKIARGVIGHPVAKGDAGENAWLGLLEDYLPKRYEAKKAFVVDSAGAFSDQIDVVIFDRQYSPFIFRHGGSEYIPAESVYAVFEAKQSVGAEQIRYAQQKAASVRRLFRTNLPITHAAATEQTRPKPLPYILAGVLALESAWTPPMGAPLREALMKDCGDGKLDIGCFAAHGHFSCGMGAGDYELHEGGRSATAFLFKLIDMLGGLGTVPRVDMMAYASQIPK